MDAYVTVAARDEIAADLARELRDQIRLTGHLALLSPCQIRARRNLELLAVHICDERDRAVLLANHHVPREPHAVFVPQYGAGIDVMAQWQRELDDDVERDYAEHEARQPRRGHALPARL